MFNPSLAQPRGNPSTDSQAIADTGFDGTKDPSALDQRNHSLIFLERSALLIDAVP
jgi:hypothetical protein